ncbi:MAG: BREX-2 system phosphatase PglZ [Acidobacteria bacterium]|nr:BREX-2 system phosphatase PglZ [Acidobacteriota bacterium]
MTPTLTLSPAHVRAEALDALRKRVTHAAPIVVGIRYPGQWSGPSAFETEHGTVSVLCSQSPLEIRERLVDHERTGVPLVILTSLSEQDLGDDVTARLAGRRLRQPDRWRLVADLFKAREVDGRLPPWLVDALVEAAPSSGFPPVASGILDLDTAWRVFLGELLGLRHERPDLQMLIEWTSDASRVERYLRADDAVRQGVSARLEETAGEAARAVLAMVQGGTGADVVPAGLVCLVLYDSNVRGEPTVREAAVRLERFRAGLPMGIEAGERWGRGSRELLAKADPGERRRWVDRADALLVSLGARDWAWVADWSPAGFEQRLTRFAGELGAFVAARASAQDRVAPLKDIESLAHSVGAHDEARTQADRAARAVMALRLVRWIITETADASGTLDQAATSYVRDGAFVDRARMALRDGDEVPAVADAYRALGDGVTVEREKTNRRFAERLAAWPGAGPDEQVLLPIERVLQEVVAPIARSVPVLVAVIDGMTWAIAHELLASLMSRGWSPLAPDGRDPLRAVVGVLPTTTEVCRASLLCGALTRGTGEAERTGFASHSSLVAVSKAKFPPRLFHKGQVGADGHGQLAQDVRDAVASPDVRVVGVVVNAVDDYLHKADQARPRWSLDYLPLLGALLYEARQAGRIVVLTSDHGHVVDAEIGLGGGEDADRWRVTGVALSNGEMMFGGPRVADLSSAWPSGASDRRASAWRHGSLVLAWSERVRYGMRKNGYHGGATPQEVLVPLLVLGTAEMQAPGLQSSIIPIPTWWDPAVAALALQPAVAAVVAAPSPAPVREPPRNLLEVAESPEPPTPAETTQAPAAVVATGQQPGPPWLDALFTSPIYVEQRGQVARLGLADDRVRAVLMALHERGGRMTRPAIGQRLELPPTRLNGLLVAVARLLNLDGQSVIEIDDPSDTVVLNIELMRLQFEV